MSAKKRNKRWDEVDTTREDPLFPPAADAGQLLLDSAVLRPGEQISGFSEKRVPVNEVVEDIPPIRRDGNTIIFPVIYEKMVLRKCKVLTEEIHLTINTKKPPFTRK